MFNIQYMRSMLLVQRDFTVGVASQHDTVFQKSKPTLKRSFIYQSLLVFTTEKKCNYSFLSHNFFHLNSHKVRYKVRIARYKLTILRKSQNFEKKSDLRELATEN